MQLQKIALVLCASGALALDASTVTVQPASPSVFQGDNVGLNLVMSGISDLYAYQLDVGFNPSVLSASSVTEGPFLSGGGGTFFFPGTIDNTAGTISFVADSLFGVTSGVSGSGVLAAVHFIAIAPGTSSITLFNISALDSFGQGLTVGSVGGLVSVSAIPEPGTIPLAGVGAACLLLARSMSRKAVARR